MSMKVLLGLSSLIHVICMAWTMSLPTGQLIPPWAIVLHVPAMIMMAFAHAVHHIGVKQAAAFFVLVVCVEWTWEQLNVWYDGFIFGNLSYSNTLLGPKIIDIPLIVPLAFAALCWPAFVMVNIILHGHPVKISGSHEGWLPFLSRCALFSFVHTAWSPCVEPVVTKFGAFGYPHVGMEGGGDWKQGTFFSIPFTEFRGWWLMAFFCIFLYSGFVAPCLAMPPRKAVSILVDSAPLVLFGGFCVWLVVCPVDPVAGMFALWAMGMPILMTLYIMLFVTKKAGGKAKSGAKRQ